MGAIFKREFKSYFRNMSGFVFVAISLLFFGIFCFDYNFFNMSPYIGYALSNMMLIVALLIPILSIKAISGEYKNGTYRLLYSLPIKSSGIILGKYFAMLAVVAVPVGVMALFPFVLNFFGKVDFGASFGALFGFFMFCAAIVAVNIFISSISDSTVVCAVVSYILAIVLYVINILSTLIPVELISESVSLAVLFGGFDSFVESVFDLRSVLYYFLVTVAFLILSLRTLEKRRLG